MSLRCAAAMTSSPLRASISRPLIVTLTVVEDSARSSDCAPGWSRAMSASRRAATRGLRGRGIDGAMAGHDAATGISTRDLIFASNSSGNSVNAECTGTYADGPTKQIVVIRYGNGTGSRPRRSLAAWGNGPGQIDWPTSCSSSRSAGVPRPVMIRSMIRSSQVAPSRHGTHLPQDSWA